MDAGHQKNVVFKLPILSMQLNVQCLESKRTKTGEQSSQISINPLFSGQGLTIGNALRRTLLSDIPGIAIIGVRISNVNHEFSSIPGVREDVIEILLNLKQTILKGKVSEAKIARLNFRGPGIITTDSIDIIPGLSFVEPAQYIATVYDAVTIDMEFLIETGCGYSLSDVAVKKIPSGFLAVDAVFMPVRKVNFFVEKSKDISAGEVEKLIFDIETDGSLTPIDAIKIATNILKNIFTSLWAPDSNLERVSANTDMGIIGSNTQQNDMDKVLIEELELSVRAYNCLKRANIHTLGELLTYSVSDLLEFKNFGQKSADEVSENLNKRFNLTLN
jgi:DNA-directed RNA polymerase subunit alpha